MKKKEEIFILFLIKFLFIFPDFFTKKFMSGGEHYEWRRASRKLFTNQAWPNWWHLIFTDHADWDGHCVYSSSRFQTSLHNGLAVLCYFLIIYSLPTADGHCEQSESIVWLTWSTGHPYCAVLVANGIIGPSRTWHPMPTAYKYTKSVILHCPTTVLLFEFLNISTI